MAKLVMIVDDDPDIIVQLSVQLKSAGYEVLSADSVAGAAKLIEAQTPDLAIIDLMMEEQDSGFKLAYQIKKKDAGIPVIMLSSVNLETGLEFDAATQEERSWIKADTFLDKPVRFEQLLREIQRLMGD